MYSLSFWQLFCLFVKIIGAFSLAFYLVVLLPLSLIFILGWLFKYPSVEKMFDYVIEAELAERKKVLK